MNMVNRSIEMKKPNTPVDNKKNHRKNCLGSGSIFHEANTPAKTMNAESSIITTDTPSTPSASLMLSGAYQVQLAVRIISASLPAPLSCKNITTSVMASIMSAEAPVTATVLMAPIPLLRHSANPASVSSGTITK